MGMKGNRKSIRLSARLLAVLLAAGSLGAPCLAAETENKTSLPAQTELAGTPLPKYEPKQIADPRVLPEPEEGELFPESPAAPEWKTGRLRNGITLAGTGAGIVLSAVGISVLFRAAGDGFDTKAMHEGLTIAVSGSLAAALFSALRGSDSSSGYESE